MQDKKDTEYTKNIEDIALNKPRMNVFHNNALVNFAHKKTERVTAALYMVTGLLPETEPIKWKLRKNGLDLLSLMFVLGRMTNSPIEDDEISLLALIVEQCSLLAVASISGAISEMNFIILNREYGSLAALIEKIKTYRLESGKDGYQLPKDFFELPREQSYADLSEQRGAVGMEQKIFPTGQKVLSGTNQDSLKTNMSLISEKEERNASHPSAGQNFRSRSRREAIISFLRDHKAVNIKEIVKVVRGCSGKTIQRELLMLVQEGVVVKEGERRWSIYSLVS